ncbi:sterol desaturase family protein [Penaeicola halotolerans]|uniref:sterol desaturase family protein n=1 Tax=Penaeicola halotolerans TaxID=2793196 RepID=UPI001CF8AA58|nr:sterol desaturase family protein [Penaeicola halotolerans]
MESFDWVKNIQPYLIGISFVLLYLAESALPFQHQQHRRQHDFKNLLIGAANLLLIFFAGFYFQQLLTFAKENQIGLLHHFDWPLSILLLIELLFIDLFMYGWHRANHTWPFLWKFHSFHHLDTQLNTTSAFRFHLVEILFSYGFRMLLFPLFGVSVLAVLVHGTLLFPVVLFHHSNVRINATLDKWLRYVIVTPEMHRVHHSNKQIETDSNYSSLLSIWDKIFRTFRQNEGDITYGLDKPE